MILLLVLYINLVELNSQEIDIILNENSCSFFENFCKYNISRGNLSMLRHKINAIIQIKGEIEEKRKIYD